MANIRQKRAHLFRGNNGEICAKFEAKTDRYFVYDYTNNTLRLQTQSGEILKAFDRKFRGIDKFEGWCRRYTAEHDL